MDKQLFFERNLLALSRRNPSLCSRLSGAETTLGRYKFLQSRSGQPIPAWVDAGGAAHPLHSMVDPQREGERLAGVLNTDGFLIFLGLGGGYAPLAALGRKETRRVLVIDYDMDSMAELLCSGDYVGIFGDPRFQLLVDPPVETIKQYIMDNYQPALSGGIGTLPLRTRTAFSLARFEEASVAVEGAISSVSEDYSVQAYFGTRWFSNIIRNVALSERREVPLPPIREASITAAGPSLDTQIPELKARREKTFLMATDTSLPALLSAGLEPDAVVSIDCQHISYYHFMGGLPPSIPLFLDLASPPLVASRAKHPRFFSGGHPLTRYISQHWRPFPRIDTAGANVTYAALSLAEYLGAERVRIYGADFSYPRGQTYARGTYIHDLFAKEQNRLRSLETRYSAFLYRDLLDKKTIQENWYYETGTLRRYREGLERKIHFMEQNEKAVIPIPGRGAPIAAAPVEFLPRGERSLRLFSEGAPRMDARAFLAEYREKIQALPPNNGTSLYPEALGEEEKNVFATLLPGAAALKRRHGNLQTGELLEAVRGYCLAEIDKVLGEGIGE